MGQVEFKDSTGRPVKFTTRTSGRKAKSGGKIKAKSGAKAKSGNKGPRTAYAAFVKKHMPGFLRKGLSPQEALSAIGAAWKKEGGGAMAPSPKPLVRPLSGAGAVGRKSHSSKKRAAKKPSKKPARKAVKKPAKKRSGKSGR